MQQPIQESATSEATAAHGPGYIAMVWRQFRRDRIAVAGLVLICALGVMALLAPFLASGKPLLMRMDGRLSSPLLRDFLAPSEEVPEQFLERSFNFALLYIVAAAVILLPLRLTLRRYSHGPAWLYTTALILFAACFIPFLSQKALLFAALCLGVAVVILVPMGLLLKGSRHRKVAMLIVACAFVAAWVFIAIFHGPLFSRGVLDKTDYRVLFSDKKPGQWALFTPLPYAPHEQPAEAYQPPGRNHLFGTDRVGRDVLARIIHGARVSLSVGILAVGVSILIGIVIGAISAYHGGTIDLLLQRLVEVVICFPTFLLILTIMAFIERRSIFNVMLVIGLTGWTGIARLVRGQMLQEKTREYTTAAQALGAGSIRIMAIHLLPNSIAPVLVAATFGVAGAILTETGLSFLGFGVRPPTASWGELLNQAQVWPTGFWWLTTFPGVMIFLTVTIYNLVGEGIRDALDPRLKI